MSEPIPSKIYLTTPLYYVNARPHLGHFYATVLADVLSRYYRQLGAEVIFLTGTDEHGERIAAIAQQQGRSPLDFANEVSAQFESTWRALGLKPDIFYRTTQPSHYKVVQAALQQLKDKDEIYYATYEGKYCLGCERFRTDQEWNAEGLCPDHLTPPDLRKESNYFFKMGAYRERIKEFYLAHPSAIVPQQYMKETLSFLEQPLEDLCISRPTSRLEWGIPLPFDNKKFVTYVWFDALLNYPAALGYEGHPMGENPNFKEDFWLESTHIIGKDILKTHAVYWPAMLFALGLSIFRRLQVSGFVLTNGMKMSKSLGNIVDPLVVKEKFGIEALRYYLMRDISYGIDSNFTLEGFIARANADLANGLGNLASRVLTLSHKNLGATVPTRDHRGPAEQALLASIHRLPARIVEEFEARRYHIGMAAFSECVAECDRYINDSKPWALAKLAANDCSQKSKLEAVLGTAMDALSTLAVVAYPVLPEGAQRLLLALGWEGGVPPWSKASELLAVGQKLGEIPRLYPRLEIPKEEA